MVHSAQGASGIGEATVRLFVSEGAAAVAFADRDEERGEELAEEPGKWFDAHFGTSGVRLVRRVNDAPRWGDVTAYDNSFADAAPVLLTSVASLRELNEWLAAAGTMQPARMDRFRPNLVIGPAANPTSLPPWAEDEWIGKELCIGDARFRVIAPCSRCSVVTIDQDTGEPDAEGRVLWELRKRRPSQRTRGLGSDQSPEFGVYLVPLNDATMQLGDGVSLAR